MDPAAFLKSVRELSEKREREDAERVRRLEEEIEILIGMNAPDDDSASPDYS